MASPATVSRSCTTAPGGMLRACLVSWASLGPAIRADLVLLDADTAVADTDYTANFDAAALTDLVLVANINGTALTN